MSSVLLKILFVGALFLGFALPINKLPEFIAFSFAFALVAFGTLRLERWRRLTAFAVIILASGVASLIRPPAVEEGFNVFIFKEDPGALSEGLPNDVFQAMVQEMRAVMAPYRCNQKQPGCWLYKTPRPDRLHVFSADGVLDAADGYSRRVYDIGFDHRDQLFSAAINTSPHYHYYGTDKNPDRQLLPVFVSHRFPAAYEGSRLCWTGTLVRQSQSGHFERHSAPKKEACFVLDRLAERPDTIVYSFDPGQQFSMRLDRTWMIAIQDIGGRLIRIFAAMIAVFLLVDFRQRQQFLVPVLAVAGTLLWIAGWDLTSNASALLDGLTIYRGGQDGLTHDSLARGILFHVASGNWIEALRGGESVFYFQPAFRYALAVGKFLFGETHYFYILVVSLVAIVVYKFLSLLFPPRWAIGLFLAFLATPVFERMGFSNLNAISELYRGHGEPLGYGALLAAMVLLLPPVNNDQKSLAATSPILAFFGGLLLALAVATRPNLVPGAAVVAAGSCLIFIRQGDFRSVLPLIVGGATVFTVLLHNLVFGGRFVLLSDVSTNPFNLRMTPQAYWDAFGALFTLAFDSAPWIRMVTHLSEWNSWSDFYRLPLLGITVYVALQPKYGATLRVIALTAIAQQGMLLFYNASGRYAFLAWMLCLLTSTAYFREELVPTIHRWHSQWRRGSIKADSLES